MKSITNRETHVQFIMAKLSGLHGEIETILGTDLANEFFVNMFKATVRGQVEEQLTKELNEWDDLTFKEIRTIAGFAEFLKELHKN